MLFEFPWTADTHPAETALRPPAILLDARNDGVRAEVADRVGMPLAGHAVRGAVIPPNASGVRRRDAHLIQPGGNRLAAVTGGPPLEDHAPVADLHLVAREEADVMTAATDVFAVLEPLHEGVVRADERPAESVRCTTACAQTAGCHALLHKHDPITEPRREPAVLLVLDHAAEEIHQLVVFNFLWRIDFVVSDKCHAAGDQLLLKRHHLEQSLWTAEPVAFEDVDVRHACIGNGLLEKLSEAWAGQVTATDCIIEKDVMLVVQSLLLHLFDVGVAAAEWHAH